ncbi:murein L,D-transpeptidase catalytic domain-containing protein [uncultured Flavobacterium sp.]|uniref:murein L,D-transpeptidase catalytic domain-containing protein n=1 Tax=uncultured Flavobacterium sp. TaxID=165435 RepID=UPI0030ED2AFD|tara:strand:- start:263151 stop:263774 length:624 start_codon:yes stop_codon:yes gene_type:complete
MKNILVFIFFAFISCKDTSSNKLFSEIKVIEESKKDYSKTHKGALAFCKEKGFEEDYYFLVDLSIHSGKKRFFIYDFIAKKVTDKNLVTHGSCDKFEDNDTKWEKVKFSNKEGSHCSSIGKYKIGKRDYSSWGINVKYWLHGLETSNNKAVERVVVLHSWNAVKNTEIYPKYSPLSWGCPAVSNEFMKVLDEKLKTSEKPVLLWIIE